MTSEEQVAKANRAFYAAFEARDLEAMGEVWECSDRATVTHPGWPTLRSWDRVAESWRAIFANTPYIQFFLTDEEVAVVGGHAGREHPPGGRPPRAPRGGAGRHPGGGHQSVRAAGRAVADGRPPRFPGGGAVSGRGPAIRPAT